MKPIVNVYWLGRTSYKSALGIQNALFENLKRMVASQVRQSRYDANANSVDGRTKTVGAIARILDSDNVFSKTFETSPVSQLDIPASNSLILLEHDPVYTIGLRSASYDRDYVAELKTRLAKNNLSADFVRTNRGGLITFHGHGQLVAYPIINLVDFPKAIPNKSVKAYVMKLEETIIHTLKRSGLEGAHTIKEYPGVWLHEGERKIAFVGISCKRYITMHGISINCDCDLAWFEHIISCGIEDRQITSICKELSAGELNSTAYPAIRKGNSGNAHSRSHIQTKPFVLPADDELDVLGPKYSVHSVANAFCSSFSQHFDCELLKR